MNANRDREEEIFDAARELAGTERAAYLAERCGQDADLRQRIEGMLAADAAAGEFFKTHGAPSPTVIHADASRSPSIEKPGDRIGRYKLLQQIGEGGMGLVYMAEQDQPVRRLVALKIIKLGMDTRQVVARFEAERQALAMMNHPHIAKVFDAGATDSGRPYFVMELVRGIPITEYCDKNCLPTRLRLDLFILVCQAVQHAHQKGIIHRDLKPSNILVTLNDGVPWPMIIDFGIAKATHQRLTEKTLFTHFAQMIGTPAYMSPEQAEMSKLDVDTRTDIYALGVLLYELLTGTTPFPTKELLSLGYREMQRTIAEREPLRLSTRLSTMANEERTVVAKNRSMEPFALAKLFRGDLDWIAMKCLEKDRTRRYETASGLATDIKRHLQNEPVAARPPSQLYRFQKAYRRNRLAFSAAALVLAAMVIAMAGIGMAARRESRARVQESIQRKVAEQERQRAEASERNAKDAEAQAVQLRQRAETGELAARQRAYASDINLAQQALAGGDLGRAQRLLNESADSDLRGWEWRYLWQQTRSDALSTLFTVPGWVYCVRSSPDGRWLAVMEAATASIHVWDRSKADTVAKLQGVDSGSAWPVFGPVTSMLAYHGKLESRINEDGLLVWNPETGRKIAELPTGTLAGFGFSRDEKILVTCDYDLTVLRWELPAGRLVSSNSFKGLSGLKTEAVQFLATRDTGTVVLDDYAGHRYALDLKTGKALWHQNGAEKNASLTLSPDDRMLAAGPDFKGGPITLYETATGRELGRLDGHRNAVRAMVFWPDGRRLASAGFDQTIRVWDIQDPAKVPPPRILRGHKQEVWGLDLLPDGKTLVSASKDGEICFWDVGVNLREPPSNRHAISNLSFWSFSPDGRSLLATDLEARELVEWSLTGGSEKRASMAFDPGADTACWSRDGSRLAVGATNGSMQVWEIPARTLRAQLLASTNRAVPLQFHKDKPQLALSVAAGDGQTRFEIWEPTSGQMLLSRSIPLDVDPAILQGPQNASFQFAPDLTQVFARTRSDGDRKEPRALLWSPADDQRLDLGPFDEIQVAGVAFSPDGKLVAASGYSGWTRVWDARTGRPLAKFAAFLNAAAGIVFTPDSQRLIVGSGGDGLCKVWDVETWRELVSLSSDGGWFDEVKFSPDGNLLGARTDRRFLQFWRAPSWEEIAKAK